MEDEADKGIKYASRVIDDMTFAGERSGIHSGGGVLIHEVQEGKRNVEEVEPHELLGQRRWGSW